MNQARAGRVTKKLAKLTPVQDFQECCNRYTSTTYCSDFIDLICHSDSTVMLCVFCFGVHIHVVCAFVWSLVWFFLFVCFRKEMRHWIYPIPYLEVQQGKIPELSKQRLICYTFVLPSLGAFCIHFCLWRTNFPIFGEGIQRTHYFSLSPRYRCGDMCPEMDLHWKLVCFPFASREPGNCLVFH